MIPLMRDTQKGFSLLEVSIALSIYSLGISGVGLLLMLTLQGSVNAQTQSVATQHATSYMELVWMTTDALEHPVYPPQPDIENWQDHIESSLPLGRGLVCSAVADWSPCEAANPGSLVIGWRGHSPRTISVPLP